MNRNARLSRFRLISSKWPTWEFRPEMISEKWIYDRPRDLSLSRQAGNSWGWKLQKWKHTKRLQAYTRLCRPNYSSCWSQWSSDWIGKIYKGALRMRSTNDLLNGSIWLLDVSLNSIKKFHQNDSHSRQPSVWSGLQEGVLKFKIIFWFFDFPDLPATGRAEIEFDKQVYREEHSRCKLYTVRIVNFGSQTLDP